MNKHSLNEHVPIQSTGILYNTEKILGRKQTTTKLEKPLHRIKHKANAIQQQKSVEIKSKPLRRIRR